MLLVHFRGHDLVSILVSVNQAVNKLYKLARIDPRLHSGCYYHGHLPYGNLAIPPV